MIKRLLLVLFVVIAAAAGWAAYSWQQFVQTPVNLTQETRFQVERGSYYRSIIEQLKAEGIVPNVLYMRILGRLHPELTQLRAGEFALEPGMTPVSLLEKLVSGETIKYHFTIIEGMRYQELLEKLAADQTLEHKLANINTDELKQTLGIQQQSLEGLFLAETYQYEKGMSDLDILKRSHAALEQTLQQAWAAKEEKLPLESPYEALILASLVEKETGVAAERPKIAGVFVKRLNIGMRLQTDPTVIYGMGDKYDGRIRRRDLQTPTPYNTYVIAGLPPTPIALVGRDAINAAVKPEMGPWLYFVAKGDGSHQFSATLAKHNAAVREYQLKRRSDYRSYPAGQ